MAFATRCPQCSTVFQVTGEQLTQHSGMVRCGVCKTSFNGIEQLIGRIVSGQEIPVGQEQATISEETLTVPVIDQKVESPASAPQDSQPEQPQQPAETPIDTILSSDAPEPVDSEEPVSLTDKEKALQEAFNQQLQSFSLEIDLQKEPVIGKNQTDSPNVGIDSPAKTEPVLTDSSAAASIGTPAPVPRKKHSFLGGLLWFFIIMILLLAAGLTGIYYYGQEITEEFPALTETVDTVCEQLSCPVEEQSLTPPVTAGTDMTLVYEAPVKDTVIPDAFNQKLSLANTGRQKLPWPELQLEIMDAKGNPLSRRTLKPKDYLPDALSKTDGIDPATKHDLQLHFEFRHSSAIDSRVMLSNQLTLTP